MRVIRLKFVIVFSVQFILTVKSVLLVSILSAFLLLCKFKFSEEIKSEKIFRVFYLLCLLSLCPLEKELCGPGASIESLS